MIELNKPGGVLRSYRYVLNSDVLAAGNYPLEDLTAVLVSGVQVVPFSFLMYNGSDGALDVPELLLNSTGMNLTTTLPAGQAIHYYCTGSTVTDFPAWNTGGDIALRWGGWGGANGNVTVFVYVTLFPLSLLV